MSRTVALCEGRRKAKNMKRQKQPILSVVMPVFNAAFYLKEAIDSILTQTFTDFEFIIIDDASTDASYEILKEYARKDKRIKISRNEKNLKQGATVTLALEKARGEFIARMDADDIAAKNRFEKQLEYLNKHPKTVAVGSQCKLIDKHSRNIGEKLFPTDYNNIYKYIFEFCPMQQPTMMFAVKRLPSDFAFYDHGMSPVEDIELIFKLFKYGKVENMPNFFLKYRIHDENSSLKNFRKSFYLTFISRMRGVVLHNYRPTLRGLIITFIQFIVVMSLPQSVTFTLYKAIKKVHKQSKRFTFKPVLPSISSYPLFQKLFSFVN